MIKLIASDLDGTLIGHDFRFRPRTLHALEAARAAGIEIVFVTGRPSRWLTPLREQTDFDSYAICSNGAVVYHLGADEVEEVNGADPQVIARAHALLEPIFPSATYTLETVDTVFIQGRTRAARCSRAPAWSSRASSRHSNVSAPRPSLST